MRRRRRHAPGGCRESRAAQRMRAGLRITVVIVIAAALVGGIVGAVAGFGLDGKPTSSGGSRDVPEPSETTPTAPVHHAQSAEQIYARDGPAVVVITSTLQTQGTALGSGFVIDKRGDILTNDHVVRGGTRIRVGFSNGAAYSARVVGADRSSDVAVVRVSVPAAALRPLDFDDSSSVEVGDAAYAIGNPFGLDRTMTAGIVSATGRNITAPNGLTIPNAIQTDAPVNHGNSGGPLLDGLGRVIGINDQIESAGNGNVGVAFAVPSNTAKTVASELLKSGHAQHPWLGVEAATTAHGVALVRVLKGSPAAAAGLRGATHELTLNGQSVPLGGDTLLAIDGKGVTTAEQLADTIAARRPGDRVKLTVVRARKRRTVTVKLGNAPSQGP